MSSRDLPLQEDSLISFRRQRRLARECHHAAAPEGRTRQIEDKSGSKFAKPEKRMSPAARKRLSNLAAKYKEK